MIKKKDCSLLLHNTFGIDVMACCLYEYDSIDELRELISTGCITAPYLHIGAGSNLLFTKNYEGVVLHSRIQQIELLEELEDSVHVRVGAGVVWDDFVAHCVANGWYGAENLSIIPGEVGASAVQNIGAYGVEVKDLIVSVETVNMRGEIVSYPVEACEYAYRNSVFKRATMKDVFVTHVCFRLSKIEHYTLDYGTILQELKNYSEVTIGSVRQAIISIRDSKLPDPNVVGNAGSFFMNPVISRKQFETLQMLFQNLPFYEIGKDEVKIPAAWMIDQCGWKGKSLGGAAVHDKQALVLVNKGGATGADVLALSDAIRASVYQKFGIAIYPEVNII